MIRRLQNTHNTGSDNTRVGVSPDPLPELGDWLAGVTTLPQRQQRQAVRTVAPLLTRADSATRDAWTAAIVDAGIYTTRGLSRIIPSATTPAGLVEPAEQNASPQPDPKDVQASAKRGLNSSPAETSGEADRSPRGRWTVPGATKGWTYTPGEGVWVEGRRVLDWCPEVTRHLVALNPRGEITERRVTITVRPYSATVPMADVDNGSVWDARFVAPGAAESRTQDALRNIVNAQAQELPVTPLHPRWDAGRLVLPPADTMHAGYRETAGTWEGWCDLVRRTMDAPKVALTLSLALGGIYLEPMGAQSFVVHLAGGARIGKTTSAIVAASLFGNPDHLIRPWNASGNGTAAWLRDLRCLTGFRDELGAGGYSIEQLSAIVFRATQGAERDVSTRTGTLRASQGGWHGALISTGNETIVGRVTNEGVAARVIEPSPPFTLSAKQAEMFEAAAKQNHGHGLDAIAAHGLEPADFVDWVRQAENDLKIPGGGPARTLGKHLAVGLAGARLLSEVCGIDGFDDTVRDAATVTLTELAADLIERGSTPGQRLITAIANAVAINPSAFPTREQYAVAIEGDFRVPETWGWDLSKDSHPGDVAVIQGKLRAIAESFGIADVTVALKELAKAEHGGQLHRKERGRDLAMLLRVGGKPRRAYVFDGVFSENLIPQQGGSNTAVTAGSTPVTAPVTTSVTAVDRGGND
ncbi:DUF927 domain-containing protein, partial [Longimycelium tulufanense]|uniref:DUF927 domain-containing protein n=1 Tax=Longimycelium tulufanense TaxID=907463 RepID=UPI00166D0075